MTKAIWGGKDGDGWSTSGEDSTSRQWQYLFVWKTDKAWAGTCRQLSVKFNDGSAAHTAIFRFVK